MGSLGPVDLTPFIFWARCPMIVAVAEGHYLVALASAIPGHNLIAFNDVDWTGYPAAAWK